MMPRQTNTGTAVPALSDDDARALISTASNLDLRSADVRRAQADFRHAYDVARRVVDGTLDPFSA